MSHQLEPNQSNVPLVELHPLSPPEISRRSYIPSPNEAFQRYSVARYFYDLVIEEDGWRFQRNSGGENIVHLCRSWNQPYTGEGNSSTRSLQEYLYIHSTDLWQDYLTWMTQMDWTERSPLREILFHRQVVELFPQAPVIMTHNNRGYRIYLLNPIFTCSEGEESEQSSDESSSEVLIRSDEGGKWRMLTESESEDGEIIDGIP